MTGYTAQTDSFARDRLPAAADLPEFLFELPELRFPGRLNAATLLLDDQAAGAGAGRPAIYAPGWTWTYADLLEAANRIAQVLTDDFGVKPGNRVLLRAPNNPMLAACWFAVLKAGAIAVATMPLLRAADLEPVIDKARCQLALADARLADELLAARHGGSLARICWFNGDGADDDLEARMRGKSGRFTNVDTASDDIALIAFTSGTTGDPKGTVHFHRDVMAMCKSFGTRVLGPRPDDIFIGSPPLAFTYGLGMLLAFPLHAGAATVLLEQAAPADLAAAIARFG
ncbi:MAG: AMP-binding protein, partial [Gammaproteobacteria bacterium]|nr:AMP-binding protein [Gammaproteobacteria bacterium]